MEELIHNYLTIFPTFLLIIIISVMLYILSKGADILVDEAVSLSLHLGVPKMIIGATIVSLGTTLPEATVSVLAAFNGNPDLALGNAIGSIIADTGLIIGISALLGSLPVSQTVVNRQGKIQLWAGILLAIVSFPFFPGGDGNIAQWVGWIFILLLILYIYSSIKWSQNTTIKESAASAAAIENNNSKELKNKEKIIPEENVFEEENSAIIVQFLKLFLGITMVIGASKILIPSVEITAVRIGIPQSIIAATLIAFGTSLPELITAVTAVKKGHGELAVGNIVGADILNVLFVVGASASVTTGGLVVPGNFYKLQIPTMLVILFSFRFFTKKEDDEITNKEGTILFAIYLIYLILNYVWL